MERYFLEERWRPRKGQTRAAPAIGAVESGREDSQESVYCCSMWSWRKEIIKNLNR